MAYRIDIGSLRKPQRLPDGRLRADAHLTRTGVFEYRNTDGSIRREHRPPTEVFNADSLASFADTIVTDDHPPELITARNARQYGVGQLSAAPRQDGAFVAATIIVNDESVIAKMESGKVQLSCGYECDLIPGAGVTPDGERYDAIQTNIRGNHVALVDVGRAGPAARVRMDAAALEMITGPSGHKENTVTEAELKAALEAATKRADAAEAALAARTDADDEDEDEDGKKVPAFLKKKMAKKDAQIEKLTADLVTATNAARDEKLRADAAEKARTDAASVSMDVARARIALEAKAKSVLGAEFKADASDRDLMVAVVKRVDGEEVPADASADFVRGLYAGAAKRHDGGADALAAARTVTTPAARADASTPDEVAARDKMHADSANAWKNKENS